MNSFQAIMQRAEARKGGHEALMSMLPEPVPEQTVAAQPDAFFLAEMTRSIFKSGFVWRVIDNKWPAFCEAFHDFDLARLMKLSDDDWDAYSADTRIVRHRQKIQALRHNLWFVNDMAMQHGGFGQFLVDWPQTELTDLFLFLKKKGSRLGGNTGQYFLQKAGKDGFALTHDVVQCLQMHGLDIRDNPVSHKDLKLIQQTFNRWHDDSGLPYLHLSMVAAYSVGDNKIKPGVNAQHGHRID